MILLPAIRHVRHLAPKGSIGDVPYVEAMTTATSTARTDVTRAVAEYVAELRSAKLPDSTVDHAKR
ncbi:MAG: hypothetical protein ACREM6_12510, partial [Vulcanimicrobiaceae bacterium]